MQTQKRDVVIFDFDGTLVESGAGIMSSVRHALETGNHPVPDETVLRKFVGPPLYDGFCSFCGLSHEEAESAIVRYREHYRGGGIFNSELYPGITPFLRALKASGAWVAVASGKPAEFLHMLIDHFGIADCFDAIEGSNPASHSSDKRSQVLAVLPEDADPSRVYMVGDRMFDIDAGRLLGMHTIGVSYGYGSREELENARADRICDSVSELYDALLGDTPRPRGRMISLEGTDGCGKSTQMKKLEAWLRARGYEVVCTREPGGCPISERIRDLVLSLDCKGMSDECEALLYAASRIEHVKKVILPALEAGKMVICDRFLDSSIAYQAYGRELGEDFIRQINRAASELVTPDCTLQFDIDREQARSRLAQGAPLDRLEIEKEEFFIRVAQGYDSIASSEPERIHRIDSGRSIDEVFRDVLAAVRL